MSIVQMDNFSIYGTNTAFMLNGIYAEVTNGGGSGAPALTTDPDGISSGQVLQIKGGVGNGYARYVLSTTQTTVGLCFRLWMDALPTQTSGLGLNTPGCWFKNDSNGDLATLWVTTTGRLVFSTGGDTAGTILGETVSPVVTANGWYHIELKYTVDSSNGAIQIRVEGQTVIDESGLNTGTVPVAQVAIGTHSAGGGGVNRYFKDFVVWDSSGSYNNDFLGSVIVYNLTPTSDVQLNWTPSVGSNGYSILDNIPPNDAQYITAPNPPPAPYICTLSDLPPDVTSVKALMTFARAAKTDGGDASLQVSLISDSTTGNGADRPITVAQTYWRDIQEIDPATSAPWLPSAVNAVEMELDRTT